MSSCLRFFNNRRKRGSDTKKICKRVPMSEVFAMRSSSVVRKLFFRQNGVERLFVNILGICFFVLIFTILTGCQTVRMAKPFSAADVLPETDSVYIKIPVKGNENMCGVLVDSYIAGLSEKNRTDLLGRAEYIYASVNFTNNSINAAIIGNFPVLIDIVFTEKNGWITQYYKENSKKIKYYVNSTGFQVAVLQDEVMLVSSVDVKLLLQRQLAYDSSPSGTIVTKDSQTLEVSPSGNESETGIKSKNEVLSGNGAEISFYTTDAGTFIEGIIGNGITLAAEYAVGSFKKEQEESYILDMELSFKNKHAVKPALFLFKKSQPSGNVETETISDMSIRCTGLNMDINTIVSLIIGG